jgi:hypothetical protein
MRRLLPVLASVFSTVAAIACATPTEVDDAHADSLDQAVMCMDSEDCVTRCQAFLDHAERIVDPPSFQQSQCELAALVDADPTSARPAPSCLCIEEGSDQSALLLSPTGPDNCLVYGRDRSCLYEKRSFPGCDLSEPESSCDAACAEVQRRLEVDAQREPRVQLRSAACAETGCRCVLRINDACYVDDWLDPYDCSRSDEHIIATFESVLNDRR